MICIMSQTKQQTLEILVIKNFNFKRKINALKEIIYETMTKIIINVQQEKISKLIC